MPDKVSPIVGCLMPKVGPGGLKFARDRTEKKAVETVLHQRRNLPRRLRNMVPAHVWTLAAPYDLIPTEDELFRGTKPAIPIDPA